MPAPHPPGRDHGPGLGPVSRCRSCPDAQGWKAPKLGEATR